MDFEDTYKEILHRHRVDVSTNCKCCLTSIRPTSKADEWRIYIFNPLNERTSSLELLFTGCPQSFSQVKIQGIHVVAYFLRAAHGWIPLFEQEIKHLLRCVW